MSEWTPCHDRPTTHGWWLEFKTSGAGTYHFGTFKDAMQAAFDLCVSDHTVVCVYDGDNVKAAEQTLRGPNWVRECYR